jgi:deoxyribodipyrimidine photolyase-related protein
MTRRWLFADQLGPHFLDDPHQPVLLVEAKGVLRRRRFHRQKAHLVLSALRRRVAGRRSLLMEDFYRDARRRHGVLMDADGPDAHEPAGGRWNLDHDNRQPPPRGARHLDVAEPWWTGRAGSP